MSDRAARFDRLYTDDADPWGFATSPYEQEKYQATLAALPRQHYRQGVEAGCSIGVLTALLAGRCERLIGVDVSEVALRHARRRCARRPNVELARAELPAGWPAVMADLIVLSELLYFLDAAAIGSLAGRVAAHWSPGGDCVLVNYLGPTGEALQGARAADLFAAALARQTGLLRLEERITKGYRLEVFRQGASS